VLKTIGPEHVDHRDGDPDAKLRILVSVEGEDAQRLQRIAEARGRARTMSSRSCSETPIARPHSPPR